MKLFSKEGTAFKIIAFPRENVCKGQYLVITDVEKEISYVAQVIDINYLDVPGLIEEIVREGLTSDHEEIKYDFMDFTDTLTALKDVKVLDCEVRGIIQNNKISRKLMDIPSRSKAIVQKIPSSQILELVASKGRRRIHIGRDLEEFKVAVNAEDLDGCLNLITGMKGSGKSHLAKLLVMGLITEGAPVIVLDINGEYIGLKRKMEGKVNVYYPGVNLYFSPKYLGKSVFLSVLTNVLNLPGVSANFFNDIWPMAERSGELTIDSLVDLINISTNNMMVKDALISRLTTLKLTGFISDGDTCRVEDLVRPGSASIIVLRKLSPINRKILVEIILSKLASLLLNDKISPLFLFAEEAHLYVRQTYWEDIITRMRHFGLFVTFITNQLDSLNPDVFKQLDNVFLFCFKNDGDLEKISKISDVDAKTVKTIVKDLPKGVCLIIGKVVSSLPIIIKVDDIGEEAMGQTKLVFREDINLV